MPARRGRTARGGTAIAPGRVAAAAAQATQSERRARSGRPHPRQSDSAAPPLPSSAIAAPSRKDFIRSTSRCAADARPGVKSPIDDPSAGVEQFERSRPALVARSQDRLRFQRPVGAIAPPPRFLPPRISKLNTRWSVKTTSPRANRRRTLRSSSSQARIDSSGRNCVSAASRRGGKDVLPGFRKAVQTKRHGKFGRRGAPPLFMG